MQCAELMKADVECCKASDSVVAIADQMLRRNIGFVPVCDDEGAVIGTITDRDLALRVIAEGKSADATTASDVMTREAICCSPYDELSVAEQLMSKYKKSRIICVDNHHHPVGVISLSDVAKIETSGKASAILRSVVQREARA